MKPLLLGNPRRGCSGEQRINYLDIAMQMLAWMIPAKDPRVRAAVLWGLKNDRCDPIWKRLMKLVSKTEIDWLKLEKWAGPLTRGR